MKFPKVLIVVVVLGIAGSVFCLLSTNNKKTALVPTQTVSSDKKITPTDTPNPAAGSTVLTTNEWKTYTNQNSKISFKYPTSAGMPGGTTPTEKTTGTGTQVSVQTPGLNFDFVIQPIRPGTPKYYGDSKFVENYKAGSITWDVSKSSGICDQNNNCGQPFLVFQTTKSSTQYAFVFTGETTVTELQQTIVSTFTFLDNISPTAFPDTQSAIADFLANKYKKPVSEVKVTVTKEVPGFASGTVLFGQGGPGEGGAWLAILGNKWNVVWDGNGNVDCNKMRTEYGFPDTILKPNFCN